VELDEVEEQLLEFDAAEIEALVTLDDGELAKVEDEVADLVWE
jgi:hypothetical protein